MFRSLSAMLPSRQIFARSNSCANFLGAGGSFFRRPRRKFATLLTQVRHCCRKPALYKQKRPPRGGLSECRSSDKSGPDRLLTAIADEAETGEAGEHHRPGRELRNACHGQLAKVARV